MLKISDGESVKVWPYLMEKLSRICAGGSILSKLIRLSWQHVINISETS